MPQSEDRELKKPLGSEATRHAVLTMRDGWWVAWEKRESEPVEIHTAPTAREILRFLGDNYSTSIEFKKGESDDTQRDTAQTTNGGTGRNP